MAGVISFSQAMDFSGEGIQENITFKKVEMRLLLNSLSCRKYALFVHITQGCKEFEDPDIEFVGLFDHDHVPGTIDDLQPGT